MPNWHKYLNINKILLFTILTLTNTLLLLMLGVLLTTKVNAQPKPNPFVTCDDISPDEIWLPFFPDQQIGEEEYHSLRPYQASPCNPDINEWKLYCGNDIIPVEKIKVTPGDGSCTPTGDGGQSCNYSISSSISITMDFTGAELPIIGNTQLVPNSDSSTNQLNSAQRMNNYVSWYLNGVINRAEEPQLKTEKSLIIFDKPILKGGDYSERESSHDKLVNFSGPLRKLLPWAVQLDLRQDQVEEYAKETRHNQVAACTFGKDINFSILGFDIFSTSLGGIPIPCYNDSIFDAIDNFLQVFNLKQYRRLTDWESGEGKPPKEVDYEGWQEYWIAYRRWRGETCGVVTAPDFIPIIGGLSIFLCLDDPINPNFWADLYPYIPFSSTEDRKGDVGAGLPIIDPNNTLNGATGDIGLANQPTEEEGNDATITSISFTPDANHQRDILFFPHLQETKELSEQLQSTYLPKDESGYTTQDETSGDLPFEEWVPYASDRCDLKDVRYNPGDDLFGEYESDQEDSSGNDDPKGPISGTIDYTAEFTCKFDPPSFSTGCYADCIAGGGTPAACNAECTTYDNTCEKDVMTAVSVYTRTPLINEIWGRLVSDEQSFFKRIYPKLGDGGMWEEIKDLPAVTSATYTSETSGVEVRAGDPGSGWSGEEAKIFIPHVGGILEYFLYGVQDALRPKDFKSSLPPGAPGGVAPGSCQVSTTAYCSVDHLLPFFDNDHVKATNASMICNLESGGSPTAANKSCLAGGTDYSIGLFQINLLAHCPEAFDQDAPGPICKIKDAMILAQCEHFYLDPDNNIEKAYQLSNGGTHWSGAWVNASNTCGIY